MTPPPDPTRGDDAAPVGADVTEPHAAFVGADATDLDAPHEGAGATEPAGSGSGGRELHDPNSLEGFETPMGRLLRRGGVWLAVIVVVAMLVPSAAWLTTELGFRSGGDAVTEALGDEAALAASVWLVRSTTCAGQVSSGSAMTLDLGDGPVVVTNRHVVDDATVISVRPFDGGPTVNVAEHRISGTADVAVLTLPEGTELPPVLPIGRDVEVGADVRVVGFPSGRPSLGDGTVTRTEAGRLHVDVPTDPGASGSPVLDADGRVVGQVFARTADGQGLATSVSVLAAAARSAVAPEPGSDLCA